LNALFVSRRLDADGEFLEQSDILARSRFIVIAADIMSDFRQANLRDAHLAFAFRRFGQNGAHDVESWLGQEEREDGAAIEPVYDLRAHGLPGAV
jgi:hypothetical protein